MTDRTVRLARPADLGGVARVQVRAWQAGLAALRPDRPATALDEQVVADRWRESMGRPPTHRHLLLVALDDDGAVVGFAALAPAADPDLPAASTAELLALHVDPAATGRGHGSRLLAAAVDTVHPLGTSELVAWLFAKDDALRRFLDRAGWGADGARRTLDLDGPVHQVRLATRLQEGT